MEQKVMEAKLIALEAEYLKKKKHVENVIAKIDIKIQDAHLEHDRVVANLKKDKILHNNELTWLRAEYVQCKAEIYKEFSDEELNQ